MKNYLIRENAYYDNNQRLIDQKIQNYIYYCIFHSTPENFDTRYEDICKIIEKENLSLLPCKGYKKVLLGSIFSGKKQKIKAFLSLYRFLKKGIHKV